MNKPLMLVTIIEDATTFDVTVEEAAYLVQQGLIYRCDDPECGPFYHLIDGVTWIAIDEAIDEFRAAI